MATKPADFPWVLTPSTPFFPGSQPGGKLTMRWLGTAGYELRCQGTSLLIDPYFSRINLLTALTRPARVNVNAIQQHLTGADAILVGHSHFDHVMDVPTIASLSGAKVFGSASTINLCRASGLPANQVRLMEPTGCTFEVGPFKVTAVPSEHSRFLFGRVPAAGEIPCSCELPLRGTQYKCGHVFGFLIEVGGLKLYHAGSAELVDDVTPKPQADLLMLCIAGRFGAERVVERYIRRIEPSRILPMHYDNFFRPLDSEMKLLPTIRFGELVDDIRAVDRHTEIATMTLNQEVALKL